MNIPPEENIAEITDPITDGIVLEVTNEEMIIRLVPELAK